MTDNPDYEGPEGSRLRQEAKHFAEERSRLFDSATRLRESGDHHKANELVEEAKKMGEKMKESNRAAAKAIVQFNNEGAGDDYLDLHGLREEEAMEYLRSRVEKLERSNAAGEVVDFRVIPGAGHHSGSAGQKLMGSTERYFKSRRIEYEQVNAGTLMAKIAGTASADSGVAAPVANPEPTAAAAPEKARTSSCCFM